MPTNEESNAETSEDPSDREEAPVPNETVPSRPPTRRELLAAQRRQSYRSRPFIIIGVLLLVAILAIPTVAFVNRFVLPPRQLAVRVEDKVFTRGDVVNFIRFYQRLSEEAGVQYQIGSSLFEAEQIMWQNEVAFQSAPKLGVSVMAEDIDEEIRGLLGYPNLSPEELQDPETRANIDEANRQFLNNVGLSAEVYRDMVRKELFRRNVRERLALDVPRIQPQVHVYEILLQRVDQTVIQQMKRRVAKGDWIQNIAVDVSIDPNVQRTGGEIGWLPRNAVPELDRLLFGADADGNRLLPVGTLSDPVSDRETGLFNIYFVSEYVEAREIDAGPFEKLKDKALEDFLNGEFRSLDVHLVLDDKIYAWVNAKVKLASILPTPTPASNLSGLPTGF